MLAFTNDIPEHINMAYPKNFPKEKFVPSVIDIEVTGRCEFNCPGCWGSKPNENEKELTTQQWLKIFEKIDDYSMTDMNDRVVITGGEPLLRRDLDVLINGLSDNGNRTISLSTTGLDRFDLLEGIIKKIDKIGIPIDGPTPEINSSWRNHNILSDGGLSTAISALKLIQYNNPELYTSVRTLVHSGNVNVVSEIPKFLEESGIDISRLRWILYELNKRITSRTEFSKLISTKSIDLFAEGSDNFQKVIEYSGRNFREVVIRDIGGMAYRNFIINPIGETRLVIPSYEKDEYIEVEFGNLHNDFKNTMKWFNDSKERYIFSDEARESPSGYFVMSNAGIYEEE